MMHRCMLQRILTLTLLAGCTIFANTELAMAQTWPNRPVTLVVPYGPGASNDLFTRALANVLSKRFNQPFVVENRAGAGAFTGASYVQKAAPDGYTFLEGPNGVAIFKDVMKLDLDAATRSHDDLGVRQVAGSDDRLKIPGR